MDRFLNTDNLDDVSTGNVDPNLFPVYLPDFLAAAAKKIYSRLGELNTTAAVIPGSQRGDPTDKDAFFSIPLKLGVTIGRKRR